jgi:RNA polymerase sigma-70 factor (ECF subfamily)
MQQADILAVRGATWEAEYLQDISVRRVVLEQYDQEHTALLRYLSFLGIDPETGREIAQETFLKLHEHLLAQGDRTHLRAWIYKVAHNLARNAQTSFSRSRTASLPDSPAAHTVAAPASSPEEELLAAERAASLQRAMDQLSAAQKECLLLRSQGFKYREIAGILNLSVSTVGEHVQRGLEKLKELL